MNKLSIPTRFLAGAVLTLLLTGCPTPGFITLLDGSQVDFPEDAIAEYLLDGDFQDDSGYDRHGTSIWGFEPYADTNRYNIMGDAMYFGGSGDPRYIQVDNFPDPTAGSGLSISFWFGRLTAVQGGTILRLVDVSTNTELEISVASTMLTLIGAFDPLDPFSPVDISAAENIGSWNHFVITIDDQSNTWQLYVNDVLIGQGTNEFSFGTISSAFLYFGTGEAGYLDGSLDDIRFFNRILSDAEVTLLFED